MDTSHFEESEAVKRARQVPLHSPIESRDEDSRPRRVKGSGSTTPAAKPAE